MPHQGSRCNGRGDRSSRERRAEDALELTKICANTLRSSHANPRPIHPSICCCKLTRSTLPSGSLRPSLPRVFSGNPLRSNPEEPGGPKPLEWLTPSRSLRGLWPSSKASVVNREKRCQPKNRDFFREDASGTHAINADAQQIRCTSLIRRHLR